MKNLVIFISLLSVHNLFGQDVISTFLGDGMQGDPVMGVLAENSRCNRPYDIDFDNDGNLYFVDVQSHMVIKVDAITGEVKNVIGNGISGEGGVGETGQDFELTTPEFIEIQGDYLYVSDTGIDKIFRLDLINGDVITYAGTGNQASGNDGNQATLTDLYDPRGLAISQDGTLFFVECGSNKIRKVLPSGALYTVSGTGASGSSNGTLQTSTFNYPFGLEIDNAGHLYVAQPLDGLIRKIDINGDIVSNFLGTGTIGYNGDGLTASNTQISTVHDIYYTENGDFLVPGNDGNRIRKVDGNTLIVSTLAGTGNAGYSGDGGDPLNAELADPFAIAQSPDGDIYWTELDNYIVRKLSPCIEAEMPTLEITNGIMNPDSTYCPGLITIEVTDGFLNDAGHWSWYYGACPGGGISAAFHEGEYLVFSLENEITFAVLGEGGCSSNAPCNKITITPGDCIDNPEIDEITAFSPNNDGINDLLFIEAAENNIPNTVLIYNRWGDIVKTIHDYQNGIEAWDGKDEFGKWVGAGTYFYIFESDNIQQSGWVQVVK